MGKHLNTYKKEKEFLIYLLKQSPLDKELVKDFTSKFYGKEYLSLIDAVNDNNLEAVKELLDIGFKINYKDSNKLTALYHAAKNGNNDIFKYLFNLKEDSLLKTPVKTIELKSIILELKLFEVNNLGLNLEYEVEEDKYINWNEKEEEVKEQLQVDNIDITTKSSKIQIQIYKDINEIKLIKELKIEDRKPEFISIQEENNTKYLLFRNIVGFSLEQWYIQKVYIEDMLNLAIDIEVYDESHELWGKFSNERLILIKESNISVMPKSLELEGKYLKTNYEDGFEVLYFTQIINPSNWIAKKDKIAEFLNKRVDILIEKNSIIKLKESIEEAIPKLLDLKDSKKNYPKLLKVTQDGENKSYFYKFLPEINLNIWKEKSKKINFRVLFKEPNKVYKLETYDKASSLYDEDFYSDNLIVLHEYAKIPEKKDLENVNILNELKDEQIFWGYGAGSTKYYTKLSDPVHMMVIGSNGSGKSNFMNGLLLSLFKNIKKISKLYLVDLKSGIEFGPYDNFKSDKIKVFSKDTKPSKLLASLYEIEAMIYLREQYCNNNEISKIEDEPIFLIIDEYAQIESMNTQDMSEIRAKEEILTTLVRFGARARSSNIKLFIQTQDPKTVQSELKTHLMSRILMKTSSETDSQIAMQNPDILSEQGIKHTSFDKGRYAFEDYNDGDSKLNELQFPFVKKDSYKTFTSLTQEKTSSKIEFSNDDKINIINQYPYLKDTEALKINSLIKEEDTIQEEIEDELLDESIRYDDDFNFDDLMNDEDEDELELEEINNLYKESYDILKELKERE